MKQATVFVLVLLVFVGLASPTSGVQGVSQSDTSIDEFWEKFRDAVIKENQTAVASLTKFPVAMPYGMRSVRNRTQLIKRYREVFNHDGSSAAECFGTAKPGTDPARSKEFTVACKNLAGDEVIIYTFQRTAAGWRFAHLDNINE